MEYLGDLKHGEKVVDRHQSHIQPDVAPLLLGVLKNIISGGKEFIIEEVCQGVVGKKLCVATTDHDEIAYLRRQYHKGPSRFVKNREAELSNKIVIILKWDFTNKEYMLITAYFGDRREPEPWDDIANEKKSMDFWNNHAFVFDSAHKIVSHVETSVRPRSYTRKAKR